MPAKTFGELARMTLAARANYYRLAGLLKPPAATAPTQQPKAPEPDAEALWEAAIARNNAARAQPDTRAPDHERATDATEALWDAAIKRAADARR